MTQSEMVARIQALKKEKNAVILAHYYTLPEIQDLADYLGDSLGLSKQAATTDADIIVFCGVHFMAETASIIAPHKKVLSPAPEAGCSLADSATGEGLRRWKEAHPNGLVVSYVNTTAEVKAWTDYCCTSSNALNVVRSLPKDCDILFGPDRNLGAWINHETGRNMELWDGCCCVHDEITSEMVQRKLDEYPDADVLIHPESICAKDPAILANPRAFFYSTAGILDHSIRVPKKRFVIATEEGTLHELKKRSPEKEFIPIAPNTICKEMKKVTLERLLETLETECGEVKVPEDIRQRALIPIERMMSL
ncbi:MAG: quinolinate synthase NadA [Bacteroidales bacterium]|jgi:quinolinate synthase|nr:quinolinate synthase NadA [Bacteroidales bacterium]